MTIPLRLNVKQESCNYQFLNLWILTFMLDNADKLSLARFSITWHSWISITCTFYLPQLCLPFCNQFAWGTEDCYRIQLLTEDHKSLGLRNCCNEKATVMEHISKTFVTNEMNLKIKRNDAHCSCLLQTFNGTNHNRRRECSWGCKILIFFLEIMKRNLLQVRLLCSWARYLRRFPLLLSG